MTRGELVTRISQVYGLEDTVGSAERTLMEQWANQAVIDVLMKTHARVELADITLIAGQNDYRLDSSVLALDDLTSTGYDMRPVSVDEMNDYRRTSSFTGDPFLFAVEGDLLMVYPTPTSTIVMRSVYVARPTPMSNDAHDPTTAPYGSLPADTDTEMALEYFMGWRAAEYDDKDRSGYGRGAAQAALDLYREACKNVRKNKWRKGGRISLPSRVGYPGTQGRPRRNDIYP